MTELHHKTLETVSAIDSDAAHEQIGSDSDHEQAVVNALQHYLRQSALTQRTHLPRWASW